MPPHLTGEQPGDPAPRKGLVRAVLAVMALIGFLAFLRAFAGGEGVAVQRLAWQSLAWTFPLLWDLTSVIGSVLWIGAPRGTAARRWGVALNLGGTIVSGLATGSQAYTLARDQVPQGWPVPAFLAGFAVPLIYSILTWAAASAAEHMTGRTNPWSTPTSSTASAPATADAPSEIDPDPAGSATPLPTAPAPSISSPPPPRHRAPEVSTTLPGPTEAVTYSDWPTSEPTTGPVSLSGSPGAGTPTPDLSPPPGDASAGAPTLSSGSPLPDPTMTPPSPSGPRGSLDEPSPEPGPEEPAGSTPGEREEWAVAELLRRAESPGAEPLRPRDIDREFPPNKDGWRILDRARRRVSAERQDATVGAER